MNQAFSLLNRLPLRAAALSGALRDWASPAVNPFLAQARRIDARGARWPYALLFLAALWGAALTGLYFWSLEQNPTRNWANDGARLWIGIVWVVAWLMERLRDSEGLRQEVIKGRFEAIQLTPLSATRRVWLWSAPNSLWGMLLACSMLPAIAWSLGAGWLSGREAVLLLLLVVLSLWSTPLWAPAAWRMQSAKPAETPAGTLKGMGANQAKAKAGDGFVMPPDLAVNARGWGAGLSLMGPLWLAMQFGSVGVVVGLAFAYWKGLPFHVRAATDEIWLNWPLFLVRWLGEAQPWFGFSLAPLLLLLPMGLAAMTIRLLRLAAVTGREPFWSDAHLALWRLAQTLQSALWFAFVLGALWPHLIEGALLASWFGTLAGTTTQALAAWWIVAVAAGALATTAMWRAALELPVGALTLRAQAPRAAKLAARGMGVALMFWLGACVLGWRWPLSALWLQLTPALLAMAAVWIAAQGASWAAQRAPRWPWLWVGWHALWFYGGPLVAAALLATEQMPVSGLKEFYPFSPWTLWLLLRDASAGANPTFWLACGAHLVLALLTGSLAWGMARDGMTAMAPPDSTDKERILDELTPDAPPANAPARPSTMASLSLARKPLPAPDEWTARLLNSLQRFDNPLLVLEMRRALAGEKLRPIAMRLLGLQALLASVPCAVLPLLDLITGYWAAEVFGLFVGFLLLMPCLALLFGSCGTSLAYDRDRLDGTLELLFLTPRSSHELGKGKVMPYAIRAALLGLAFSPAYVVGALLLAKANLPILIVLSLVAPLWFCALAARGLAGGHWMALKKRKIGAGSASFALSLGVALALIAETAAVWLAFWLGLPFVVAVALAMSAIYALEAMWLWKLGISSLEGWRTHGAPGAN